MPIHHRFLTENIDPIDDVRRGFECYYTEKYFDPVNGDWISDDYYRIIDLSTKPDYLTEDETGKLERSIARLNEKYKIIEKRLGCLSLLDTYNSVARQITTINTADPNRGSIPPMQSIQVKVES